MSDGRRILRNTTLLTIGDKLGYLLQFVFFLYFARKFGVIPTGEYSFAFSFTYISSVFADLGISIYLVREVARDRSGNRELFYDCLVLRAVSICIIFFIGAAVLIFFFPDSSMQKIKVIAYWGGYWVFFSIADVFLAELNGHQRMGRVALLGIWLKLLSSAAGLLMIYLGVDYGSVMIVFPISSLIYLFTCILVSSHTLGPVRFRFRKPAHYKSLIGELMPFFSALILVEVLFWQDILFLGIIKDDQAVGIYSSGIKIASFVLGVSTFIYIAILPVLSKLFLESREKLIETSEKILRYLVLLSLPVAFGLTAIADKVISLFYSDLFQDASIVLKITSWTIVAGFTQAIFSALLTAIDRQKEKVIFIAINFGISTILNVVFIYYFNFIGAAIVKVLTAVIGLVFFAYLVSKYLTLLSIIRPVIKPLIACLTMAIFIHYFYAWGLIYLIPVSGCIYVASLLLLGGITKDEIRVMKSVLPGTTFK